MTDANKIMYYYDVRDRRLTMTEEVEEYPFWWLLNRGGPV